MITPIITGAVGAFLTYKAIRAVAKTWEMEEQRKAAFPEAWEKAGVSYGWKAVAAVLVGVAVYFALTLAFISAGFMLLSAAIANAIAMGTRDVRAQEARVAACAA